MFFRALRAADWWMIVFRLLCLFDIGDTIVYRLGWGGQGAHGWCDESCRFYSLIRVLEKVGTG